jgi:hypothetical protein
MRRLCSQNRVEKTTYFNPIGGDLLQIAMIIFYVLCHRHVKGLLMLKIEWRTQPTWTQSLEMYGSFLFVFMVAVDDAHSSEDKRWP